MDIRLLLKLSELKEQEINALKDDFITLKRIVADLEEKVANKKSDISEFIEYTANSIQYIHNPSSLHDGRIFLQKLNLDSKNVESSLCEGIIQRNAAYESLIESVSELKKLTKLINKERKSEVAKNIKKEISIQDTLELYRFNKLNIQI